MKANELKKQLNGITGISITPFKENGDFDAKGYEKNLKFLVDNGVNKENAVLVVAGSTGESGALTTSERKEIFDVALSTVGNELPIVAGCNSTNVYEAIELAQYAEKRNAAGVMAIAPYYYPPKDDNTIYDFYKKLSDNINTGILLYNNLEVMGGVDFPLTVLEKLEDLPNIVGLKECTPNFFKMTRVVQEIGDNIAVVNGHGEMNEPYAAMAGTSGFISSIANFAPQKTVGIWEARKNGDYTQAKKIRDSLVPYMDLAAKFSSLGGEYKVISLLKYASDLVGSCGGYTRIPSSLLQEEEKAEIKKTLEKMQLI